MKEDEKGHEQRILLKLSGEILAGGSGTGIDPGMVRRLCTAVLKLSAEGCGVGIVIGGGNFIRGRDLEETKRVTADQMGMLATLINALALKDSINGLGGRAIVLSAIPVEGVVDTFTPDKASEHLDSGSIVIYAGGTGNAFLTTDTAAALRAVQTGCSMLLKGTKVNGIYDSDPEENPEARRFETLSYEDVLRLDLKVMDAAAIAICRDAGLPISVFDIWNPENLLGIYRDPSIGSWIGGKNHDR